MTHESALARGASGSEVLPAPTRADVLARFADPGPFDAIGDVHGCLNELVTILGLLGYETLTDERGRLVNARHPEGRRAIFLGDLVDRGPDTPGTLRLAMGMMAEGNALGIRGNHDDKLARALRGNKVRVTHGLELSLSQLADEDAGFREEVTRFCADLPDHLVLDGGRLIVAHAGLPEELHGRVSERARAFALYGQPTGLFDDRGRPIRLDWARDYTGNAMILYGHTVVDDLNWVNNTLCLDTGCVFGGALSAMRYPELETFTVPAERLWYSRPPS